jgi:hypothetical protein
MQMTTRLLLLLFTIVTAAAAQTDELWSVCEMRGGDPNCKICSYMRASTGEVVKIVPLNPSCVGRSDSGSWTTKAYEGSSSSFDSSGNPIIPEASGSDGSAGTGKSGYLEAGFGLMSRILVRILNDGGYYSNANQQVAKRIRDLKDNINQRIAQLDTLYNNISKTSDASRQSFTAQINKQSQAIETAGTSQQSLLAAAQTDSNAVPANRLTEFPATENQTIFQFLETDQRKQEIEQSLSLQHLRPEGYSIANSLENYRSSVYGHFNDEQRLIVREEAKWNYADSKASSLGRLAARDLGYAARFADGTTDRARLYAALLLQESQSARFLAAKRLGSFRVATLSSTGSIGFVSVSSENQIPANSLGNITSQLDARTAAAGMVRESLKGRLTGDQSRVYANVSHQTSYIVEVTGVLLRNATRSLFNGDIVVSKDCLEITEGLLKAAFVTSPVASAARDLYEYLSGEDLLTGQKLTDEQRALAGWSLMQFGTRFLHVGVASLKDEKGVLLPPEARPPEKVISDAESIASRGGELWKRLPEDTGDVVRYISKENRLPSKFVTIKEAKAAGWNNGKDLSQFLPGKSIGGDVYKNVTDPMLPNAERRIYYEADLGYKAGPRTGYRVVFSNDGKMFVSPDHYKTWIEIK